MAQNFFGISIRLCWVEFLVFSFWFLIILKFVKLLHHFKRSLRTKQNMDIFYPIKQWCRIGIVVDSDVEEIKYVLMLGPDGFTKTEYMSQVLKWKAEGTTFAIRRLENPLSLRQSQKLRTLSKFFTTIDEESGKYKDLFTL